jgi:hypothetical protein
VTRYERQFTEVTRKRSRYKFSNKGIKKQSNRISNSNSRRLLLSRRASNLCNLDNCESSPLQQQSLARAFQQAKEDKRLEYRAPVVVPGFSQHPAVQRPLVPADQVAAAQRRVSDRRQFCDISNSAYFCCDMLRKCQHNDGSCPVTRHCADMKHLWKHIPGCKDQKCLGAALCEFEICS